MNGGESKLHAWRDDPNCSAARCARSFTRWWGPTTPKTANEKARRDFALEAYTHAWVQAEAEARNESVDDIHPRDAR